MKCKSGLPLKYNELDGGMLCCDLNEGHVGRHQTVGEVCQQQYTLTWTGGMPIPCTRCGAEKHPSDLITEPGEDKVLCNDCWLAEYDKDDDA